MCVGVTEGAAVAIATGGTGGGLRRDTPTKAAMPPRAEKIAVIPKIRRVIFFFGGWSWLVMVGKYDRSGGSCQTRGFLPAPAIAHRKTPCSILSVKLVNNIEMRQVKQRLDTPGGTLTDSRHRRTCRELF